MSSLAVQDFGLLYGAHARFYDLGDIFSHFLCNPLTLSHKVSNHLPLLKHHLAAMNQLYRQPIILKELLFLKGREIQLEIFHHWVKWLM